MWNKQVQCNHREREDMHKDIEGHSTLSATTLKRLFDLPTKLMLFASELGTSQLRPLVWVDKCDADILFFLGKSISSEAGTLLFTVEAHLSLIAQLVGLPDKHVQQLLVACDYSIFLLQKDELEPSYWGGRWQAGKSHPPRQSKPLL